MPSMRTLLMHEVEPGRKSAERSQGTCRTAWCRRALARHEEVDVPARGHHVWAVPHANAIQLEVRRRSAAAVIGDAQEEAALWKQRALKAEARVAELVRENEQLRAKVAELEDTVK